MNSKRSDYPKTSVPCPLLPAVSPQPQHSHGVAGRVFADSVRCAWVVFAWSSGDTTGISIQQSCLKEFGVLDWSNWTCDLTFSAETSSIAQSWYHFCHLVILCAKLWYTPKRILLLDTDQLIRNVLLICRETSPEVLQVARTHLQWEFAWVGCQRITGIQESLLWWTGVQA